MPGREWQIQYRKGTGEEPVGSEQERQRPEGEVDPGGGLGGQGEYSEKQKSSTRSGIRKIGSKLCYCFTFFLRRPFDHL